jgi:hypothetical protein
MFRQVQRIPFKSVAVRKPRIGKSKLLLANLPAIPALHPLNFKIKKNPLQTDRNRPKSSGNGPPKNHIPPPTNRTAKLPFLPLDGKYNGSSCVSGANIVIANKTKTVIQKARGHTSPPIKRNRFQFLYGGVCPLFSTLKYA